MRECLEIRPRLSERVGFSIFVLLYWLLFLRVLWRGQLSLGVAVLAIGVCFLCVAAYSWWRLAMVADDSGLLIRNFIRTHHIAWDDIADFRIGEPRRSIHVLCHDGLMINVDVTRRRIFEVGDYRNDHLLNELLSRLP
jgi:hypothetical protein